MSETAYGSVLNEPNLILHTVSGLLQIVLQKRIILSISH